MYPAEGGLNGSPVRVQDCLAGALACDGLVQDRWEVISFFQGSVEGRDGDDRPGSLYSARGPCVPGEPDAWTTDQRQTFCWSSKCLQTTPWEEAGESKQFKRSPSRSSTSSKFEPFILAESQAKQGLKLQWDRFDALETRWRGQRESTRGKDF